MPDGFQGFGNQSRSCNQEMNQAINQSGSQGVNQGITPNQQNFNCFNAFAKPSNPFFKQDSVKQENFTKPNPISNLLNSTSTSSGTFTFSSTSTGGSTGIFGSKQNLNQNLMQNSDSISSRQIFETNLAGITPVKREDKTLTEDLMPTDSIDNNNNAFSSSNNLKVPNFTNQNQNITNENKNEYNNEYEFKTSQYNSNNFTQPSCSTDPRLSKTKPNLIESANFYNSSTPNNPVDSSKSQISSQGKDLSDKMNRMELVKDTIKRSDSANYYLGGDDLNSKEGYNYFFANNQSSDSDSDSDDSDSEDTYDDQNYYQKYIHTYDDQYVDEPPPQFG